MPRWRKSKWQKPFWKLCVTSNLFHSPFFFCPFCLHRLALYCCIRFQSCSLAVVVQPTFFCFFVPLHLPLGCTPSGYIVLKIRCGVWRKAGSPGSNTSRRQLRKIALPGFGSLPPGKPSEKRIMQQYEILESRAHFLYVIVLSCNYLSRSRKKNCMHLVSKTEWSIARTYTHTHTHTFRVSCSCHKCWWEHYTYFLMTCRF